MLDYCPILGGLYSGCFVQSKQWLLRPVGTPSSIQSDRFFEGVKNWKGACGVKLGRRFPGYFWVLFRKIFYDHRFQLMVVLRLAQSSHNFSYYASSNERHYLSWAHIWSCAVNTEEASASPFWTTRLTLDEGVEEGFPLSRVSQKLMLKVLS